MNPDDPQYRAWFYWKLRDAGHDAETANTMLETHMNRLASTSMEAVQGDIEGRDEDSRIPAWMAALVNFGEGGAWGAGGELSGMWDAVGAIPSPGAAPPLDAEGNRLSELPSVAGARGKKEFDDIIAMSYRDHPYISVGADLAGGLMSPGIGGAKAGAKFGTGRASQYVSGFVAGGATGFVEGLMRGEGDVGDRLKTAGLYAAAGGAIGSVLSRAIGKYGSKFKAWRAARAAAQGGDEEAKKLVQEMERLGWAHEAGDDFGVKLDDGMPYTGPTQTPTTPPSGSTTQIEGILDMGIPEQTQKLLPPGLGGNTTARQAVTVADNVQEVGIKARRMVDAIDTGAEVTEEEIQKLAAEIMFAGDEDLAAELARAIEARAGRSGGGGL